MVVQGEHKRLTLTVPEVAQMLGIGRNTAYELARAGRLPVVRLGKRFLVPVAALERWLEERAQPVEDRD